MINYPTMTTTIESSTSSSIIPVIDISSWTTGRRNNDTSRSRYIVESTTSGAIGSNDDDDNDNLLQQQERYSVVEAIGKACCEIGFFAVVGHNVSDIVVTNLLQTSKQFFDLPTDIKLLSKTDNEQEYPYGYENNEQLQRGKLIETKSNTNNNSNNDTNDNTNNDNNDTTNSVTVTDLKETFSIGPYNIESGMPSRRFPSATCPELQSALEIYYKEMEYLSLILLRIMALALQLPPNWFDNKMDHHCSALRILNYYQLECNKNATGALIQPGTIRASAHTDYGAVTILKSGGRGLQVKKDSSSSTNDDEWIDVPLLDNAFIINLGDLMPRWTNDKWVSTLHRVIVPYPVSPSEKEEAERDSTIVIDRRQSIAYFCNVNGDTIIETIDTCYSDDNPTKYPDPITAMDHLMSKHLAAMSATIQ